MRTETEFNISVIIVDGVFHLAILALLDTRQTLIIFH